MRRTKIIATLGPKSNNIKTIKELIVSGVNVFRLNFSHQTHSWHETAISNIRTTSLGLKQSVSILADLQGPKLRTGELEGGNPIYLKKGQKLILTTKNIAGNNSIISTSYKRLPLEVKKNDPILINDGLLRLKVIKTTSETVETKVIVGGKLEEKKGINLPDTNIKAPSMTAKDKKDLTFCLKQNNIDYMALSFVRAAKDIKTIKDLILRSKKNIPVIAKIEKPQAVENIDEILDHADGIMVARGDLGVEMNIEKVPLIQKMLIEKASLKHKIVITATQMLESMINAPTPTRAEASDVSNAIIDGTDSVMLSGETAVGNYPAKTVQIMSKLAEEAENSPYVKTFNNLFDPTKVNIALATASAAHSAIHESRAKALMLFTISGATAILASKIRPSVPIIAATPLMETYKKLPLLWGVIPVLMNFSSKTSNLIDQGKKIAFNNKLLKPGDTVIVLIGDKIGEGLTNVMKILKF